MKQRIFQIILTIKSILTKDPKSLEIENFALRQQLAVFKESKIKPRIRPFDRILWVLLRCFWKGWEKTLAMVDPKTVVSWHRQGFKLFWKYKSKKKLGRPKIDPQIRKLIIQMVKENSWGAPRIHGELLKLGFNVSESTISNYIPKRIPTEIQKQNWKTFLHNHLHNTVSMDFFVVPNITFKLLYCLIIFDHSRRKVLHFNVSLAPHSVWIKQQIREAFPYEHKYKYFIHDNDKKFSFEIKNFITNLSFEDKTTAYRSPWQNPYCERMIGTIKKELLNNVIVFNERHLLRLLKSYFFYYHQDRTHMGLKKDSPDTRRVSKKKSENDTVISLDRVGGLYHRYEWKKAA